MVSLTLKSGTRVKVDLGCVEVTGGCVALYSMSARDPNTTKTLIMAYSLLPGETVRLIAEGEYVVEF